MGMFSKLKDQFIDHDEYEDEYEDEMDDVEEDDVPRAAAPTVPRPAAARNIGRTAVPARQQAKPFTMVVVNPKSFSDCEKIAAHLKQSRPVVMNMEETDQGIAQRIVDYVQGVMFALDGNIDRVSESIYLCAPNNMSVSRENYVDAGKAAPVGDAPQPQWQGPQA
jgi:cell division inhibitor SepF